MPWVTDVHISDVEGSFGDYILEQELRYICKDGIEWVTPAGFIGDLSSIPGIIRPFIPKTVLGKAPWLHDFLYRCQPHGSSAKHRKQADTLYRDGALDEGMGVKKAYALYYGLRIGGWMTWNSHKKKLGRS